MANNFHCVSLSQNNIHDNCRRCVMQHSVVWVELSDARGILLLKEFLFSCLGTVGFLYYIARSQPHYVQCLDVKYVVIRSDNGGWENPTHCNTYKYRNVLPVAETTPNKVMNLAAAGIELQPGSSLCGVSVCLQCVSVFAGDVTFWSPFLHLQMCFLNLQCVEFRTQCKLNRIKTSYDYCFVPRNPATVSECYSTLQFNNTHPYTPLSVDISDGPWRQRSLYGDSGQRRLPAEQRCDWPERWGGGGLFSPPPIPSHPTPSSLLLLSSPPILEDRAMRRQ